MRTRWLRLVGCFAALLPQLGFAVESDSTGFRDILEIAEVGPDVLAELGQGPDYSENDWRVLLQVANRLERFGDAYPARPIFFGPRSTRPLPPEKPYELGDLLEVHGTIMSVQALPVPPQLAEHVEWKRLYLCQKRLLMNSGWDSDAATILSTHIPNAWQAKQSFHGSFSARGVLVQFSGIGKSPLLLTNHIAWHPGEDSPPGLRLLAKHGMDVALLDEVRHRQPFVKPTISREGEAFYAALAAIGKMDSGEIATAAIDALPSVVATWRARQPELLREHRDLETKQAQTTDAAAKAKLEQELKRVKNQRALAATVVKQGDAGRSSVAPMFLQPGEHVGQLFVFDGTARRAVWIAAPEENDLDGYFELEVYPTESRLLNNQPVVCCMRKLPAGFPTGDEIRAPVRVAGAFFKLWRYRSREIRQSRDVQTGAGQTSTGQTGEQRPLYTPVLLGRSPVWIQPVASSGSRGPLWAGMGFLAVLLALWVGMAWLARRDRATRASLKPRETIEL